MFNISTKMFLIKFYYDPKLFSKNFYHLNHQRTEVKTLKRWKACIKISL